MFCVNCGNSIDEGSNFCRVCGNKIERKVSVKQTHTNATNENNKRRQAEEYQPYPEPQKNAASGMKTVVIAVLAVVVLAVVGFFVWQMMKGQAPYADEAAILAAAQEQAAEEAGSAEEEVRSAAELALAAAKQQAQQAKLLTDNPAAPIKQTQPSPGSSAAIPYGRYLNTNPILDEELSTSDRPYIEINSDGTFTRFNLYMSGHSIWTGTYTVSGDILNCTALRSTVYEMNELLFENTPIEDYNDFRLRFDGTNLISVDWLDELVKTGDVFARK